MILVLPIMVQQQMSQSIVRHIIMTQLIKSLIALLAQLERLQKPSTIHIQAVPGELIKN